MDIPKCQQADLSGFLIARILVSDYDMSMLDLSGGELFGLGLVLGALAWAVATSLADQLVDRLGRR